MDNLDKQITEQRNVYFKVLADSNKRYLYKLVDSVKVIIGSCSLLRNQALLKGGEAAVHIMLQTWLQIKQQTHCDYKSPIKNKRDVYKNDFLFAQYFRKTPVSMTRQNIG